MQKVLVIWIFFMFSLNMLILSFMLSYLRGILLIKTKSQTICQNASQYERIKVSIKIKSLMTYFELIILLHISLNRELCVRKQSARLSKDFIYLSVINLLRFGEEPLLSPFFNESLRAILDSYFKVSAAASP
jgi:hypothetical protein